MAAILDIILKFTFMHSKCKNKREKEDFLFYSLTLSYFVPKLVLLVYMFVCHVCFEFLEELFSEHFFK